MRTEQYFMSCPNSTSRNTATYQGLDYFNNITLSVRPAWVAPAGIELLTLALHTTLTQSPQRVAHNASLFVLSLTHGLHQLSSASPWPVTESKEMRYFRKHYVIGHPSNIFEFLLIATLTPFLELNSRVDALSLRSWASERLVGPIPGGSPHDVH